MDLLDDDSSEINNAQYAAEIPSRDSPTSANKDDRKAELERRREERRQVKRAKKPPYIFILLTIIKFSVWLNYERKRRVE